MAILIALIIHEAAHLFVAIILKIRFKKVKITFFGFNLKADLENISYIKKILLFTAGPVSNILMYILFNYIYNNSYFAYINIFLAYVNLIPIVPLDGGNICKVIFEIFLDVNSAHRYMIMTNSFFTICFIIVIYLYKNWLFLLLIVMALKGIIEENRCLLEKSIKHRYDSYKRKRFYFGNFK